MNQPERLTEKVPDPRLRRLAETGSGAESVIVELEVPTPMVEMEQGGRCGGIGGFRMASVRLPSEDDERLAADIAAQAWALIGELAEEPPVTLLDNTAYTVLLSGPGIARLAQSPLVRRIVPNRRLR